MTPHQPTSKVRRLALCLLTTTLLACVALVTSAYSAPAYPFPQHIAYAPGSLLPNHRTEAQRDNAVRAYYDTWKMSFLVAAGMTMGHPLYRIAFDDPTFTVSEGQGFGMMIMALMAGYDANAQVFFDGLWRFTRQHPSICEPRVMAYKVPEDANSLCSAFDGDADMTYALLLADKQWGSGGAINYHPEALTLLGGIKDATIGPASHLPMLGDFISDPNGKPYNQYTPRSSDFMLDHFRAFGRATADPVWDQVVMAIQTAITGIQTKYSPLTGLLPDFLMPRSRINHTLKPARARFLEGPFDGKYYYNALRDPWRLGTDGLLNNNATTLAQVRKLSLWAQTATGGNPQT